MITVGEQCMARLVTMFSGVATAASARFERNRDAAVPFNANELRPFVGLTDDDSDEEPDYGVGVGCVHFLRKPRLEIKVGLGTTADCTVALDNLKGRARAALEADYTLGGLGYVELGGFHTEVDQTPGIDPAMVASAPINLEFFTVDGAPDQVLTL